MTDIGERLSAYLDGELPDNEAQDIETLLEQDADVRAEFDALMDANALAQEEFEAMLATPASLALARAIDRAEIPERAPDVAPSPSAAPSAAPQNVTPFPTRRLPAWAAMAASAALAIGGGVVGYTFGTNQAPPTQVVAAGWLSDIADYHEVYSRQSRHLVEVSADESEHIQTWLGNMTGTSFSIPDLSAAGLTFEGGRLLVAGGNPVAQLVYTDASGAVLALCLQGSDKPEDPTLTSTTIKGYDMVSWRQNGAAFVVVGPDSYPDLEAIAQDAAEKV